jgi:hypothetical protein
MDFEFLDCVLIVTCESQYCSGVTRSKKLEFFLVGLLEVRASIVLESLDRTLVVVSPSHISGIR